jgi:hypothetical protein
MRLRMLSDGTGARQGLLQDRRRLGLLAEFDEVDGEPIDACRTRTTGGHCTAHELVCWGVRPMAVLVQGVRAQECAQAGAIVQCLEQPGQCLGEPSLVVERHRAPAVGALVDCHDVGQLLDSNRGGMRSTIASNAAALAA